jgi:hypothetical protein
VGVHSIAGRKAVLRYGNRTAEIELRPGERVQLNPELQRAAKSP